MKYRYCILAIIASIFSAKSGPSLVYANEIPPRDQISVSTDAFQGSLRQFDFFHQTGRCDAPRVAPRGEYETREEYSRRVDESRAISENRCNNFIIIVPWVLAYRADDAQFSMNLRELFVERSGEVTYTLSLKDRDILSVAGAPPAFDWEAPPSRRSSAFGSAGPRGEREQCMISVSNNIRSSSSPSHRCTFSRSASCSDRYFIVEQAYFNNIEFDSRCYHLYGGAFTHPNAVRLFNVAYRGYGSRVNALRVRSEIERARRLRDIEQYLFIVIEGSLERIESSHYLARRGSVRWQVEPAAIRIVRWDTGENIASWISGR